MTDYTLLSTRFTAATVVNTTPTLIANLEAALAGLLGLTVDVAHTGACVIPDNEKAAASGVASLDAASLVVQNPANATATPTASKIPIADASGKLAAGWGGSASTLCALDANARMATDIGENVDPGGATAWGVKFAGTAGEILAYGDVIYFKAADSKWWKAKADASATATVRLGISLSAAAADAAVTVLRMGVCHWAATQSWTVGAVAYLSAATAGAITQTCPSTATQFVRVLGHAIAADCLEFFPSPEWVEIQ